VDIKDAVAVVTGGASGLGLATTKRLLDAGAQAQAAKVTGQIKAGQDHNAALVEQNKRPKLSTPVSMRASSPPKRLAPKPRLQPARPQSEDPTESQ